MGTFTLPLLPCSPLLPLEEEAGVTFARIQAVIALLSKINCLPENSKVDERAVSTSAPAIRFSSLK